MSDDHIANEIDLRIPGLRNAKLVGRGGFAAVYSAIEEEFDRPVAVKVLHGVDQDGLRRFSNERLLLGKVSGHPNVVSVYRSGLTDNGDPYLVMELVDGGSLSDRLTATGPLRWTDATGYALAVCEALEHVHGQEPPIIHNDIKPGNILIQASHVKLADFGVAAAKDASTTYAAGSLHFSPPEMWTEGRDTRDQRSDVYSLAATLYTFIAGRAPFQIDGPDSEPAQRTRIETQSPEPLTAELCPPGLADWIARAMAKQPSDRPQSASEFGEGLRLALDASDPGRAVSSVLVKEPRHWLERPVMLGILAAFTVIGGLISLVTVAVSSDDAPDQASDELAPSEQVPSGASVTASTDDDATLSTDQAATNGPGSGTSVIIGQADRESRFPARLYAELLADLGYEVSDPSDLELPIDEVYPAIADRTIEVWLNARVPGHEERMDKVLSDGTRVNEHVVIVDGQLPAGGLFGLLITRITVRDHDIRSLDQINDTPELVELFDHDGNGKADIFGCEVGHGCSEVIEQTIAFNNWTNLEQINGNIGKFTADTKTQVSDGLPVMQYKWAPSEHTAILIPGQNVLWLSMGSAENVIDGSTPLGKDYRSAGPAPIGSACTDDPCWLGWAWDDIGVAVNKEFLEANPAAARLFEVVSLTETDLDKQIADYMDGSSETYNLGSQVREWMEDNPELVAGWLAEAREAADA